MPPLIEMMKTKGLQRVLAFIFLFAITNGPTSTFAVNSA
jgi:hypothetical protein